MNTSCLGPGCTNPIERRHRRGRTPLYCSPNCRRRAGRVTVEVDHEDLIGRPVGRVWLVRLRRRNRTVVVATGLGRPSADYLADQIACALQPAPRPRQGGDAIG
ncbi:MAG TPA: hypothetical protein VFI46_14810 [Jiangellaceae bacterium]|nr:hypothetical protein [Jiangellaceae bacterium]